MRTVIYRFFSATRVSQVVGKLTSEAPAYWTAFKAVSSSTLHQKVTNLNNWYTRILGLDEVRLYQERVVNLQLKLLEKQEQRRDIGRLLAAVRNKSNQLQDEIHKVKRQENIERFLALMKEETEVLRSENDIARTFQECDQAERELFTAFTNAVRDSHEKQRAQLEYTKYFGIILSIGGSFLAFCYTTFKKDDLKRFIEDSMLKNATNGIIVEPGDANHEELIDFVKSETVRLTEMINFNHKEVAHLIESENERMKRQLFYIGVGVVALFMFKLLSTN